MSPNQEFVNHSVSVNAREIGECIYCGATEDSLRKEHAVPYGLNGAWTLLRASCEGCAKITHKFERDTMRSLWPHVRIVLAMQSRRRRERAQKLPLIVDQDGSRRVVEVPLTDYPTYLPVPLFPQPGVLSGRKPRRGIMSSLDLRHLAGPTFAQVSEKYPGSQFVGTHINFGPDEFARTLAKIGFCAGVYALGLAPFRQTPIRAIILGADDNIGHWVGAWEGEQINPTSGLHAMKVIASGSDIHVIIRLFAQFGGPEYHVALGPADPAFVASDAWPFS